MKFNQNVFSSVALALSVVGTASGAVIERFRQRELHPKGSSLSSKGSDDKGATKKSKSSKSSKKSKKSKSSKSFCSDVTPIVPASLQFRGFGEESEESGEITIASLTDVGDNTVCIEIDSYTSFEELDFGDALAFRISTFSSFIEADFFNCSTTDCSICDDEPLLDGMLRNFANGLERSQFAILTDGIRDRRRSMHELPVAPERKRSLLEVGLFDFAIPRDFDDPPSDQCPPLGSVLFQLPEDTDSVCSFWTTIEEANTSFEARLDDEPRTEFCESYCKDYSEVFPLTLKVKDLETNDLQEEYIIESITPALVPIPTPVGEIVDTAACLETSIDDLAFAYNFGNFAFGVTYFLECNAGCSECAAGPIYSEGAGEPIWAPDGLPHHQFGFAFPSGVCPGPGLLLEIEEDRDSVCTFWKNAAPLMYPDIPVDLVFLNILDQNPATGGLCRDCDPDTGVCPTPPPSPTPPPTDPIPTYCDGSQVEFPLTVTLSEWENPGGSPVTKIITGMTPATISTPPELAGTRVACLAIDDSEAWAFQLELDFSSLQLKSTFYSCDPFCSNCSILSFGGAEVSGERTAFAGEFSDDLNQFAIYNGPRPDPEALCPSGTLVQIDSDPDGWCTFFGKMEEIIPLLPGAYRAFNPELGFDPPPLCQLELGRF